MTAMMDNFIDPRRGPGVSPLTAGGPGRDRQVWEAHKGLAQACREVEELFLTQLLGALRRTLLAGLKKSDTQAEKYQTLAEQEVAKALAASGGLGVGRLLYQHLAGEKLARPERQSHGQRESEPLRDPRGTGPAAVDLS